MATYNNKTISQVILAPSSVQPSGATGDARIVMVSFVDSSMPINRTITWFKNQSANYANQITEATQSKSDVDGIIALTANL